MIDWRHWHNEPYLVGGLIFLGWLYAILAGPWRPRLAPAGTPFPRGRAAAFAGALILFYLAVGSPLDQIGERFLFSAHMLQHQILVYPSAVLFLLGLPAWMIDPVLSRPALRPLLGFLFNPIICGIIFTLVVSLWHMPDLYDLALRQKTVHVLEHVMFFGSALFYWWPLLSPSRAFPPASPPVQMLYLLGVVIGMTPIFAYLVFSDNILYPTYEFAPRLVPELDAAADQLLAGTMMKLGGMAVAVATLTGSFWRWAQERPATLPGKRPAGEAPAG
jgi:putative membrane protein